MKNRYKIRPLPVVLLMLLGGCQAQSPPPKGWIASGVPGVLVSICPDKVDYITKYLRDQNIGNMSEECLAAHSDTYRDSLIVRVWCKDIQCNNIAIKASQVSKDGSVLGDASDYENTPIKKGQIAYLKLALYEGTVRQARPIVDVREFTVTPECSSIFCWNSNKSMQLLGNPYTWMAR
jgi:hypothetical protein